MGVFLFSSSELESKEAPKAKLAKEAPPPRPEFVGLWPATRVHVCGGAAAPCALPPVPVGTCTQVWLQSYHFQTTPRTVASSELTPFFHGPTRACHAAASPPRRGSCDRLLLRLRRPAPLYHRANPPPFRKSYRPISKSVFLHLVVRSESNDGRI